MCTRRYNNVWFVLDHGYIIRAFKRAYHIVFATVPGTDHQSPSPWECITQAPELTRLPPRQGPQGLVVLPEKGLSGKALAEESAR